MPEGSLNAPTITIGEFRGPYRFLSNFYGATIKYKGMLYPTSEHAYQAAKTVSERHKETIRTAHTPGIAKRLGREVPIRSDWEDVKVQIMADILEVKFSNPRLRKLLMNTGTVNLVEGNNWGDTFWGVSKGKGYNVLGKLLMEIRSEIRLGVDHA